MAGDPANAALWEDADVYVTFDLNASNPADIDADFGPEWDLVGLLNGEDGFGENREEETNDHFAWGGILVRTARRNFKLTRTFTALEYNDTTRRLLWPGSTESEIYVPKPESLKIAFETREGSTKRRVISAYRAECTVNGEVNENETDLATVPFIVTVFPTDAGKLFDTQSNIGVSS